MQPVSCEDLRPLLTRPLVVEHAERCEHAGQTRVVAALDEKLLGSWSARDGSGHVGLEIGEGTAHSEGSELVRSVWREEEKGLEPAYKPKTIGN